MKQTIVTLAASLVIAAIGCKEQSYKYVEIGNDLRPDLNKEKQIEAATDSAAYLEAYKDFCISLKVNQDMRKSMGQNYPLLPSKNFQLFNDKKQEITNTTFFVTKEKREKEIRDEISAMASIDAIPAKPNVINAPPADNMQKNNVKIIKYYTSEPNSASGVDCDIIWKNISSKTIKYVYFNVVPYNAVEDIVNCSIRGYSETRVSTTGQNLWVWH